MSTTNEVGKMTTSNGERLHQWSKSDYYGCRMDAPMAWGTLIEERWLNDGIHETRVGGSWLWTMARGCWHRCQRI